MTSNYRELTGRERQRLRKLITTHCASYDKEYGCLPLDCDCPMFGICYTNSTLCRYFRSAVLPEDAELEAVFNHTPTMKAMRHTSFRCSASGRSRIPDR